jgi:hypothetical protein
MAKKMFAGLMLIIRSSKGMARKLFNVAEGIAKNNPQFRTGGILQHFDPNFDYNVANGILIKLDNMSIQLENTHISLESYYKMMNSIN